MKKKIILFLSIITTVSLFFAGTESVNAASLYLSPKSGIYNIGSTFSVKVMVDTDGEPINVGDGVLDFDPNVLEVENISKVNSILNAWVVDPTFNNTIGKIEFQGGTAEEFIGADGNIISITFKALSNAEASVSFSSGAVLASDGRATNLLTAMQGGSYSLEPESILPPSKRGEEPLLIFDGTPLVPTVFSSTHSNEDAWYSNSSPEFSWEMQSGVTALRFLINENPVDLPKEEHPISVSNKKFEELSDGVWYFHIRFKNQYGWGEITHRKVLIDSQPPLPFNITIDNFGDETEPSPILFFESEDLLSGINTYKIKIGQADPIETAESIYKIIPQRAGEYTVIVWAIDAAGLSTAETSEFKVAPIKAPVITSYPQYDKVGNTLAIEGVSLYSEAKISIFVSAEGGDIEKGETMTNEDGSWSFIYNKSLEEGLYQIWADVTDSRGARSDLCNKETIVVTSPTFIRIGRIIIDYLSVVLILTALVGVLALIIFFIRYKVSAWRKKLKVETKEAAMSVVKAFVSLEKEIQGQVEYLDKKPGLNNEEQQIYNKLKRALDESKRMIGREIKDIERELK